MIPFRTADRASDATRTTNAGDGPSVDPAQITVEDLALSFGDLSVLEDVSLSVEPGEFVGFVGPNGAGKTTLLRAISGAIEPDAGTVSIDGVDVHDVSSKASSRLVSVVPQDTTLSFSFPVEDVVEMGRHPHRSRFGAPTPEDRAAVERALERTRTADLADRPIDEVSGGQRQRVVLARAIAQEAPVMLLDEPTASLDVNHQLETLELVRELVGEGRTVCAAIHDLDLAARYCDRLVMVADGSVYRSGPPADVLTEGALGDVFDATAAVTPNPVTGTETVTALPTRGTDGNDGPSGIVHVVGAGRTAASAIARLETGTDLAVTAGPVTSGDVAAETARSLDVETVEIDPFASLSAHDLTALEERVEAADATVVADLVVGPESRGVLETLASTPALVFVDDADGGRPVGRSDENDRLATLRERALETQPEQVLDAVETALARRPSGDAAAERSELARSRLDPDGSYSESESEGAAESSSD